MKKKNIILSSILTLILCFSLAAGATFALFTSETTSNIAVTSGKVSITASIDQSTVATKALYAEEYTTGNSNMSTNASVVIDGANVTIDKFLPGDGVKFEIAVQNDSNVAIQYRAKVSAENDNYNGLVVTINGSEKAITDWASVSAGANIANIPVTIELPASEGNDYQDLTTNLIVTVEAVQGNAAVLNPPENSTTDLLQAFNVTPDENDVATVTLAENSSYDGADWVGIVASNYVSNKIVIEGNGSTIYNLSDSLLVNGFTQVTIRNLTISNANIVKPRISSYAGKGAFIEIQESGTILFSNCHLTATQGQKSIVTCTTSGGYAGGFMGYMTNNTSLTIENSSVSNAIITGYKSVGGLLGHLDGKIASVSGSSIMNTALNEITSSEREWGVGAVMGRASAGATLTMTDITLDDNNSYSVANPNQNPGNDYVGDFSGATVTLDGNGVDNVTAINPPTTEE